MEFYTYGHNISVASGMKQPAFYASRFIFQLQSH